MLMQALARYTMKSPYYAAATVALVAIMSLLIPMLSLVSGGLVALILLTQGWKQGIQPILAATLVVAALTWWWRDSWMIGASIGLVQWLPLVLLALVLRWSRSLSVCLVSALVLGVVLVLLQQLGFRQGFEQLVLEMLQEIVSQSQSGSSLSEQQTQSLAHLAELMGRAVVPIMMLTWMLSIIIGRWLQLSLKQQSFADEFTALRLGRLVGSLGLLLILIGMLNQHAILQSLQLVGVAVLMLQGLAVLYRWLKQAGRHSIWFWLYCLLMLFMPLMFGVTALLGGIDNWVKLAPASNNTESNDS